MMAQLTARLADASKVLSATGPITAAQSPERRPASRFERNPEPAGTGANPPHRGKVKAARGSLRKRHFKERAAARSSSRRPRISSVFSGITGARSVKMRPV